MWYERVVLVFQIVQESSNTFRLLILSAILVWAIHQRLAVPLMQLWTADSEGRELSEPSLNSLHKTLENSKNCRKSKANLLQQVIFPVKISRFTTVLFEAEWKTTTVPVQLRQVGVRIPRNYLMAIGCPVRYSLVAMPIKQSTSPSGTVGRRRHFGDDITALCRARS